MWNSAKFQLLKISSMLKDRVYTLQAGPPSDAATASPTEDMGRLFDAWKGKKEIILDLEGNFLTWNEHFETISGYRSPEILKKDFGLLFSEKDLQVNYHQRLLKVATALGCAGHLSNFVRRDRSEFYGSLKLVALRRNKEILGYSVLCSELPGSGEDARPLGKIEW